MLTVPLGDFDDTRPLAAVYNPSVTHVGQAGWIRQRRKELDKLLGRIEVECSRVTAADILKVLPEEEVSALRDKFDSSEQQGEAGRLNMEQFINFMLDALRKTRTVSMQEEQELAEGLAELFLAIDFDGSGSVDWEEFTHYILHSYHALSNQTIEFLPYRISKVQSRGREPHRGTKLQWLPELRQILCVDTGRKSTARGDTLERSTVKIVDPSTANETFALVDHPGIVVSAAFIPERQKLVLGTENAMLEYYSFRTDRPRIWTPDASIVGTLHWKLRREYEEKVRMEKIAAAKGRLRLSARAYCSDTSLVLHWDALMGQKGLLFGGTRTGDIYMYDVDGQEDQQLPVIISQMKGVHQAADGSDQGGEPVTAFTTIPGIAGHRKLISSSFFGQVHLTDVEKQSVVELRGTLQSQQHHQGVYSIDYHEDLNLLVTAGFETDAILWMPIHSANQFVARLSDSEDPHKHSLLGAKVVPGTNQIITCDAAGMLKMWDVRKANCMHTWFLERGLTDLESLAYRATNFILDPAPESRALYCTARTDTKEARLYTMRPQKPLQLKDDTAHDEAVSCVLYNPATNTFISAAGNEIRLWDAERGAPALSIPDAATEHITAVCLDRAGRRFVVGTHNGNVSIHSFATGAAIQRYQGHAAEVTAVCYLDRPKFIASASLDGEVNVFNDANEAETSGMVPPQFTLRAYGAVCSLAYSPTLHLLAFGDAREVLHIWDFHTNLYCNPQAKCVRKGLGDGYLSESSALMSGARVVEAADGTDDDGSPEELNFRTDQSLENYMNPKASEVTALTFMTPLAAVVSSDATGHMSLWSTRPYQWAYEMFAQWRTKSSANFTNTNIVPVVTSLDWSLDADSSVVSGDDHGTISVWDMRDVIQHMGLVPTSFPPPWTGEKRKDERKPEPFRKKPFMRVQWTVCADTPITSVSIPPSGEQVVASSADHHVTIWSLEGALLGQLCQGRKLTDPTAPDYRFHCPVATDLINEDDAQIDNIVARALSSRGGVQQAPRQERPAETCEAAGDAVESEAGSDDPFDSTYQEMQANARAVSFRSRSPSGHRRSVRLSPLGWSGRGSLSAAPMSPTSRIAMITALPDGEAAVETQRRTLAAAAANVGWFSASPARSSPTARRNVVPYVVSVVDDVRGQLGADFMSAHDTYTPPDSPPPPKSVLNSPAALGASRPRYVTRFDSSARSTADSILNDPTSPSAAAPPLGAPAQQRLEPAGEDHHIWASVESKHQKLTLAERVSKAQGLHAAARAQTLLWSVWDKKMDEYRAVTANIDSDSDDEDKPSYRGIVFGRRPLKAYAAPNVSAALLASVQADPATRVGGRDVGGHGSTLFRNLHLAPAWIRSAVEGFKPGLICGEAGELLAGQPWPDRRQPDSAAGSAAGAAEERTEPPSYSPTPMPSPRAREDGAAIPRVCTPERGGGVRRPGSVFAKLASSQRPTLADGLRLPEGGLRVTEPEPEPDPELRQPVTFEHLLQLSAPNYPIAESPYLAVGRSAPALSPAVFPTVYRSQTAGDVPSEMRSSIPRRRRHRNAATNAAATAGSIVAAAVISSELYEEACELASVYAVLCGVVAVMRSDPLRAIRYPAMMKSLVSPQVPALDDAQSGVSLSQLSLGRSSVAGSEDSGVREIRMEARGGATPVFAVTDTGLLLSLDREGAPRRALGKVAELRWDGRLLVDFSTSVSTPAWPVAVSQDVQGRMLLRRVAAAASSADVPHRQLQDFNAMHEDIKDDLRVTDRRRFTVGVPWLATSTSEGASVTPELPRRRGRHKSASAADDGSSSAFSPATAVLRPPSGILRRQGSASSKPPTPMLRPDDGKDIMFSWSEQLQLPESFEHIAEQAAARVRRATQSRVSISTSAAQPQAGARPRTGRRASSLIARQRQEAGAAPANQRVSVRPLLRRSKLTGQQPMLMLAGQQGCTDVADGNLAGIAATRSGGRGAAASVQIGAPSERFGQVAEKAAEGRAPPAPHFDDDELPLRAAGYANLSASFDTAEQIDASPLSPCGADRSAAVLHATKGQAQRTAQLRKPDPNPRTFHRACHTSNLLQGSAIAPEALQQIRLGPMDDENADPEVIPAGSLRRRPKKPPHSTPPASTAPVRAATPTPPRAAAAEPPQKRAATPLSKMAVEAYLRKVEDGPIETLSITTQKTTAAGDAHALRVGLVSSRSTVVKTRQTRTIHAVGLGRQLRPEWIPTLQAVNATVARAAAGGSSGAATRPPTSDGATGVSPASPVVQLPAPQPVLEAEPGPVEEAEQPRPDPTPPPSPPRAPPPASPDRHGRRSPAPEARPGPRRPSSAGRSSPATVPRVRPARRPHTAGVSHRAKDAQRDRGEAGPEPWESPGVDSPRFTGGLLQ
eukprot:TRINITY_DN6682_c0_g3_i2.p1 TRINITY_DN6682_c0_g3~~TRINITY_DN6682_c0_g3_i2.p1  ORF type:complete len:2362 (+),score=796.06 TRINITY_DN6682_c0_g3_i2:316-7401(+)